MNGTVEMIDRDAEARRHLWRGLARMRPPERVAFVSRCAGGAGVAGVRVEVTSSTASVHECYMDLALLSVTYGRCMHSVCAEMESWLSGRG